MTVKKPPKKVQSLRISQDLLHRIATLERTRANELKTQAAVVRTAIGLGIRQAEYRFCSGNLVGSAITAQSFLAIATTRQNLFTGKAAYIPPDPTYPEDEMELYRLSVRLSPEMLERLETLAKKRGAEIHHTTQKIILSPTILYSISIGLDLLEQLPDISISDMKKLEPVKLSSFVRSY
jgi:predicted DNA-binding protein